MYGTAEGMSRRRPNAPPPLLVVVAVASKASSLPRLPRCRATRPLRSRTGSRATFLPLLPFNCFWCRTARRRRLLQQLLYVVTACVRAYGQARFVYGIALLAVSCGGLDFIVV
jgi:hypothetical protein